MVEIGITSITEIIEEFLNTSPLNKFLELNVDKVFDSPLVAVAAADDPLFSLLTNPGVGWEGHLLPTEWLPGAVSVISYYLPFSESVRRGNYHMGLPSAEWLFGRIEGENCNLALRRQLAEKLVEAGGQAVAPPADQRHRIVSKRSNWSERHVAYIAGLGTFALNRSVISEKGCSGRYGSVITNLKLEPTPRKYTGLMDHCSLCGSCIRRCPCGAITMDGMDRWKCSDYLDVMKERFAPRYGCGKCQTKVPCELAIPRK